MKRNTLVTIAATAVISVLCCTAALSAGDSSDPIISKSYLDNILVPNILSQVDAKIDSKLSGGGSGTASSYVAVAVSAGQTILGDSGTELILRSGSATAVCPGSNGLVDATGGIDLTGGSSIVSNHVYIVPRNDGRGMMIKADGYIMVKGSYQAK